MQCTGDPYRYPGVDPWYGSIGEVTPVNFYDAQGARLNARVWACATPLALPAIAKAARACDNGLRCQEGAPPGWREPVGAGMWCGRDVAKGVADVDEDMA